LSYEEDSPTSELHPGAQVKMGQRESRSKISGKLSGTLRKKELDGLIWVVIFYLIKQDWSNNERKEKYRNS